MLSAALSLCSWLHVAGHESARHYREAYSLAFAQQLKNKDIPEGGSKGVLLIEPRRAPPPALLLLLLLLATCYLLVLVLVLLVLPVLARVGIKYETRNAEPADAGAGPPTRRRATLCCASRSRRSRRP